MGCEDAPTKKTNIMLLFMNRDVFYKNHKIKDTAEKCTFSVYGAHHFFHKLNQILLLTLLFLGLRSVIKNYVRLVP